MVRQTCVVTLDPVENEINETIKVDFAPPREGAGSTADIEVDAAASLEEVEPLIGNAVDLGLLATEFFILGIDPYPRRPDAAFDAPKAAADPGNHAFAGLAALQKKTTVKK